jgi:adenosylhomocysteine nucleosidase
VDHDRDWGLAMLKITLVPHLHHVRGGVDVVVLSALDLECQAVARHLQAMRLRRHPEGTLFETGRIARRSCSVALARTGPGNTTAALVAERAIVMFRPKALLFVGVAGALHNDVRLGDVVVATKIYAFHGGKLEPEGFLPRPQVWQAPHALEQLAGYIHRSGLWTRMLDPDSPHRPQVHLRPVAAGEIVVNARTGPVAENLRRNFTDAAAVDMESVGVACTGHLNRSIPVLCIRGISDLADGHKTDADRAGWQHTAAAHAAAFALHLARAVRAGTQP